MKPEPQIIEAIKISFAQMKDRNDLLLLLNAVKPHVFGENAKPFTLRQLTWYANPKVCKNRYKTFKIPKKSGEERTIHAPVNGLKAIQTVLSVILQSVFEPQNAATGFVWSRSIVDNAKKHEGAKYVYNIDLKDFFPSIDQARVWACLQLPPFNLKPPADNQSISVKTGVNTIITEFKEKLYYKLDGKSLFLIYDKQKGYKKFEERVTKHLKLNDPTAKKDLEYFKKVLALGEEKKKVVFSELKKYIANSNKVKKLHWYNDGKRTIANIIAALCCTELEAERKTPEGKWEKVKKNVLPQGAPTSPVLTNVVCQKLDYLLSGVAKRFGLTYSRYADDITFSSMHNVYQPSSAFLKELHRIIGEQNFHIKESKTRLQKDGYRKEVTGLLVNEKANVQQRYIKQMRMWLYYWERYGYERAYGFFLQHYIADKGHLLKGKPDMANVISGKLDYLKMVKGGDNELYMKLRSRYEVLTGSSTKSDDRQQHLNEVLDALFDKGLDDAMNIYKPTK